MSEEQVQNEEVEVDAAAQAKAAADAAADAEAAAEEAAAEAKRNEEKVICYLSKASVPISDTVEVKYNDEGVFRVQAHLVRF